MIILLRVDLSQEDVGQVGFGRIVVSETEVPILTVSTTYSGEWMGGGTKDKFIQIYRGVPVKNTPGIVPRRAFLGFT